MDNSFSLTFDVVIYAMTAVSEIDNLDQGHTKEATAIVELSVSGVELKLKESRMGSDFVFGFAQNSLVAVPAKRVSAMRGSMPEQIEGLGIIDFLSSQRVPVRLDLETDGGTRSCWLLNIEGRWLRVSTRLGVEWVYESAIVMARVGPVYNFKP